MRLFENIINHKINTITGEELLKYANQFNISVSKTQADQIAGFLRGKHLNIFDDQARRKVIKEIARVSGPETARAVNRLFTQFTQ